MFFPKKSKIFAYPAHKAQETHRKTPKIRPLPRKIPLPQNIFSAFSKKGLHFSEIYAIIPLLKRPVGQAAKTSPFHGENMGSIPVRVTKRSPTEPLERSNKKRNYESGSVFCVIGTVIEGIERKG